MSDAIHDSTEELRCSNFSHHKVGVLAWDCGETIEFEMHGVRLWNSVTGRRVKRGNGDAMTEIATSMRTVIGDIDAAIHELTRQRERLSGLIPEEKPAPRRLLFDDETEHEI